MMKHAYDGDINYRYGLRIAQFQPPVIAINNDLVFYAVNREPVMISIGSIDAPTTIDE